MDIITMGRATKFLVHLGVFAAVTLWFSLQHSFEHAAYMTLLLWSMLVLCTPVINDSYVIRFIIRFFTRRPAYYTSFVTWFIALLINTFTVFFHPMMYRSNIFTVLLQRILMHPSPYWSLIVICAFGSFYTALLEYYFGTKPGLKYQLPGYFCTIVGFFTFFYFYGHEFIIFLNIHA